MALYSYCNKDFWDHWLCYVCPFCWMVKPRVCLNLRGIF